MKFDHYVMSVMYEEALAGWRSLDHREGSNFEFFQEYGFMGCYRPIGVCSV
jgi:hypothetical protein